VSQEHGPTVAHGPRMVAGRYAILNELGRGGMGIVWLAEDTMIGRHVAIKELHLPEGVPHSERTTFEQRVLREARTAGRLNDPAVVTVYDVVQESGATYIVMELIQAPTLSDVIKERGPLPAEQVAKLADQLLSALDAAHQAGIIHRDVKPSNIMLAANGRAKLTDFGIAQSLDDPRLTSSGILIGSPSYMAPERIRGEEAGAPSDLWALGAVLFYAIEGYSPYERATTAATMHSILSEVPYLTRGQGALASVVTGLMINTPQARLNSGQARGLLAHVQTGQMTGPTVMNGGSGYYPPNQQTHVVGAGAGPKKKSINSSVALTLAAVLAVLAGVGGYFLSTAVNSPSSSESQHLAAQILTYGPNGDVVDFEISNSYCSQGKLQSGVKFASGDDCKEPFAFQVYGYADPASGSSKIGYFQAELKTAGQGYCDWLFQTERVKGTATEKADLAFSVLIPSQANWEAESNGDRTIFCVVSRKDTKNLDESQVTETN